MDGLIRAVKSDSGEWEIEILGIPFGSPNDRDSDGEYFTPQTKFHLDKYPLPPLLYYHSFKLEGGKLSQSDEPIFVGKTTSYEVRSDGIWWKGVLDKTVEEAAKVWDAIKSKAAVASSGSIAHVARKIKNGFLTDGAEHKIKPIKGDNGKILVWPPAELSVFDSFGGKNPANKKAVVVQAMKAVYERANIEFPDHIEGESSEVDDIEANDGSLSSETVANSQQREVTEVIKSEGINMELNEVQKLVADSVASALKAENDKREAEAAQQRAIAEQVEAAVKSVKEAAAAEVAAAKAEAAEARRLPGGDSPYVTKFSNVAKYDDLSAADAAILTGILGAAKTANRSNGASENLLKYLAIQIADSGKNDDNFGSTKSAMKMAGMPMKANELNQSTLASYGDEWVGVAYSTELWDKIRLATPVVGRIPTKMSTQNGAESMVIPISGASPTFYKVAQASAQDANPGRVTSTHTTSRLGTGSVTLNFGKLGAASNYSGELDEDSLINWASYIREDLTKEAAEVLEHIVIDGDTATGATTNINDIGGTPAGTEAFLLFNGFRKLALVTNTANSRSAGTLAIEDYLETIKLMGLGGRNAVDKSKVSFITDMFTQWKSLELAELKTADVYSYPTIEKGVLTNVYGYDVITSANMHRANQDTTYGLRANTSGKIDLDTAANNTTGSILAVRWDQWMLGYRRQMRFEVERDAISDSNLIVVNMRVGMVNRDNEASAISYNVTLS